MTIRIGPEALRRWGRRSHAHADDLRDAAPGVTLDGPRPGDYGGAELLRARMGALAAMLDYNGRELTSFVDRWDELDGDIGNTFRPPPRWTR